MALTNLRGYPGLAKASRVRHKEIEELLKQLTRRMYESRFWKQNRQLLAARTGSP